MLMAVGKKRTCRIKNQMKGQQNKFINTNLLDSNLQETPSIDDLKVFEHGRGNSFPLL